MIEEVIRVILAVITFTIAGIMDWRTREINPYIWLPTFIIGIFLGILKAVDGLSIYQIISLTISIVIAIIVTIMVFLFRLMGGADFLAVITFISLYPYTQFTNLIAYHKKFSSIIINIYNTILIMPPIITVLLIYTIVMLFFLIYNTLCNLRHVNVLNYLGLPLYKKIYFIVFHKIIDIDTLFKRRFYYPIFIPGKVDRISFNIYEDDLSWREKLKDMPKETMIIASWGIPMVTFLSISVLIYSVTYFICIFS
jgi:preflagellin peptidase FlaK